MIFSDQEVELGDNAFIAETFKNTGRFSAEYLYSPENGLKKVSFKLEIRGKKGLRAMFGSVM